MNGPPFINLGLSPSELEALKAKIVSGQSSPSDILRLLTEIENLHAQFKAIAAHFELYQAVSDKINTECYTNSPSIMKIQDWSDELKYAIPNRGVDVPRMQTLLASVLHQTDVTGVVNKDDKLVLEIRRFLSDADLIKRN